MLLIVGLHRGFYCGTRGQERAPLEHGMRSPGEPGNFAFLEGARTPDTCRVRPGRGDGTEGGEAWPKGVGLAANRRECATSHRPRAA